MVSTFTPNLNLEEPARGDQVGTWDTPENSNMTLVDLVAGAINVIALNNTNVVLSAAQFQSKTITFNSTLTGSVTITFPSTFKKSYEIYHSCTGSSAFTITLATTVAGGQVICAPPGEIIDVVNDGTNLRFKGLGRVGEYWDYAGSAVPNWVTGCTVPPYLACVGGAVSSATYPVLFSMIGATLPDTRGRARYALDAGVGRVSVGVSGINGNTLFAGGGDQSLQAHTHANSLNDPSHVHGGIPQPTGAGGGGGFSTINGTMNSAAAFTGMTINNASAGAGGAQNMPPVYVGGITMIRAA